MKGLDAEGCQISSLKNIDFEVFFFNKFYIPYKLFEIQKISQSLTNYLIFLDGRKNYLNHH